MRTLLINTYDNAGGAARAVHRLHQGFQRVGVESRMLVKQKFSEHQSVKVAGPKESGSVDRILRLFSEFSSRRVLNRTIVPMRFSPVIEESTWIDIEQEVEEFLPEVVHLNWICNRFLSLRDISEIRRPIVWTLHDSWPFTGGCHIPGSCHAYREECGHCPQLESNIGNDLSRLILERKKKHFAQINLTIVAPSRWLADCARSSRLFGNRRVEVIPNGLDTDVYRPVNRSRARELLGLPQHKRIILFGAIDSTSDPNKGFRYLQDALSCFTASRTFIDTEFVIFGASAPADPPDLGIPTHYMGRLHDDFSLVALYSAADVMIVSSLQEAFCQTASEAMSCGTPVVAFATTGLLDIVDHQVNGYLARPFEPEDLAHGIRWVLQNDTSSALSSNARNKAEKGFCVSRTAKLYRDLYCDLITPS